MSFGSIGMGWRDMSVCVQVVQVSQEGSKEESNQDKNQPLL